GQRVPDRKSLEPHARGEVMRALAAEVKPTGDHGQHPGGANRIGGQIGHVGRQYAERDFDGSVIDAVFDLVDDFSNQKSEHDSNGNEIGKAEQAGGEGRVLASHEQSEAKFEGQERAGIVDQALAFKDVHDAFGQSDALGNGGGGDRVRGSHHSAENQTHTPVKTWN